MVLHELLDASAMRFPGRPALSYRGNVRTYAALVDRTARIAGGLERLGVRKGDRVAIHLQNRPEVIELALACSRLGAVFVPANPMLKARQLDYLVRHSAARVLVASATSAISPSELEHMGEELTTIALCDTATVGVSHSGPRRILYEDLLNAPLASGLHPAIDNDPAAILYTSGSTGRPKGVVVSHRNLVSGAQSVTRYLGNTAEDRLLAALPLSFDYGFSQVSTALCVGACAVLSNFALPAALVAEVTAEGITGLAGVPAMWAHLANAEWPQSAVSSLRYITNSGGAIVPALLRSLQTRLPATKIYCMYGLTEAFRSTYLEPAELPKRPGSIGKAIPNQEILVLREDGTRCVAGEVGELVHRGSLVTLGYWNDPEATARRFRPLPIPGFGIGPELAVWSGDQVRTDEDGYLYFVGRADALIKTSGYRVSPTEIEEVVGEVAGVIESCAIGVPDPALGHRIVVAVVADAAGREADLVERLHQYCRMQMPAYMTPSEIRIVDVIPRNANGKHDRSSLATALRVC